MSNEEFYDTEIEPALLELARKCEARGMSFVASVEYSIGNTGETCTLQKPGIKMLTAYWGIKCHGNIDSFMITATKHAREHGHQSIYLEQAGVPHQRRR